MIRQRFDAELEKTARALAGVEPISELPSIRVWREAYGAMGVKPSKYRSSIESLLRRAQKRQELATDIALVDLYNAVSLAARAPIGGYDAEKLKTTPITLRFARPTSDHFDPLGATSSDFPIHEGLVVYASDDEVLCWGFNSRDSKAKCISAETKTAIFFSETTAGGQAPDPVETLKELCRAATEMGSSCGSVVLVSASNRRATLQVPILINSGAS
jgi:lysyl-tRNA synthetase class 2